MNDLSNFKMSDMIECGSTLRLLGKNANSMEEAAQQVVRHLYEKLEDGKTGEKACGLVRFYKTHPFGDLPPDLREFACRILGDQKPNPEIKCLTLMATAGEKPEWNSRKESNGHKAIPLPSEQMVVRFPMISQLIHQLGLEISQVVKPNPGMIVELEQKMFNVFHIAEAVGSEFVPAQNDFVIPHGIKSVLGFGGMLPTGDLMVVIIFAKVHVSREVADLFKTLALNAKMAVFPFVRKAIFS